MCVCVCARWSWCGNSEQARCCMQHNQNIRTYIAHSGRKYNTQTHNGTEHIPTCLIRYDGETETERERERKREQCKRRMVRNININVLVESVPRTKYLVSNSTMEQQADRLNPIHDEGSTLMTFGSFRNSVIMIIVVLFMIMMVDNVMGLLSSSS